MIREVKCVPFTSTYSDLNNILLETHHRSYPLIDNPSEFSPLFVVQVSVGLVIGVSELTPPPSIPPLMTAQVALPPLLTVS